MARASLTQRQKEIILMLPQKGEAPIKTAEIAERFNLSSRTVKRDLGSIERWFETNDFELIKRPGFGLLINEDDEMMELIRELLNMEQIKKHYQKEERIRFILSSLLSSDEPVKSFLFLNYLQISEKTLSMDLNDIELWLKDFNLELARRSGEGLSLRGSERAIRSAQINLIYEDLDDAERFKMIRDISDRVKDELVDKDGILSMMDRNTIEGVESTIKSVFKDFNIDISDSSYVGLVIHISIAIERIKAGERISMDPEFLEGLKDSQEYIFALKLVRALSEFFELDIVDDEVGYITMHIKGAKFINTNDELISQENLNEITTIAHSLIAAADKVFQVSLIDDKRLEIDLKKHIAPVLSRLNMGMRIRNPILKEIKERYTEVYDALDKIAPTVFLSNSSGSISSIPDDEIGYLTMHFASAIERAIGKGVRINAFTACPTGIGTSRLLKAKLESRFKALNIIKNVSLLQIDEELLDNEGCDMIISTVNVDELLSDKIKGSVTCVTISPFFDDDEISNLGKLIREISRKKIYNKGRRRLDNTDLGLESHIPHCESGGEIFLLSAEDIGVLELMDISTELNTLYKGIKIGDTDLSDNADALISSCSRLISDDSDEVKAIDRAFRERWNMSVPYIDEFNLLLLHAVCDIKEPHLGFFKVRGTEAFKVQDEDLSFLSSRYIIAMALPESARPETKDVMGLISSEIVESGDLLRGIDKLNTALLKGIVLRIIANKIRGCIEIL